MFNPKDMSGKDGKILAFIAAAAVTGHISLLKVTRKSDGKEVTILCIQIPTGDGQWGMAPIAEMIPEDVNVNEEYSKPNLYDEIKKSALKEKATVEELLTDLLSILKKDTNKERYGSTCERIYEAIRKETAGFLKCKTEIKVETLDLLIAYFGSKDEYDKCIYLRDIKKEV